MITPVHFTSPVLSSCLRTWDDVQNKGIMALVSLWIHKESISPPVRWHFECQFMSTCTHRGASGVCSSGSRIHTQCSSSVSLPSNCSVRKIKKEPGGDRLRKWRDSKKWLLLWQKGEKPELFIDCQDSFEKYRTKSSPVFRFWRYILIVFFYCDNATD